MPFLSIPDSLRSVDVQVGGRAIRGLLVLAAVVLAVLAGRWWWVQQGADAVPVEPVQMVGTAVPGGAVEEGGAPGEEQAASEGATSNGAAPAGGEPPTGTTPAGAEPLTDAAPAGGPPEADAHQAGQDSTPPSLFVHVIGQVRRPGVVELPAGARVVDAVEAAGGFTDAADQSSVNLARGVLDGEQVWVAAPGEEPPPGLALAPASPGGSADGTGAGAPATGAAGGAAQSGPERVDLNRATQPDLEALPGIGPVTAGRILAWRDEHGRFTTVEELMEVSGIGERTFAQLEPLVVVGD